MKQSESWLQHSENTARRELKVGTKGANPASQALQSCSWQCPQVGQDMIVFIGRRAFRPVAPTSPRRDLGQKQISLLPGFS